MRNKWTNYEENIAFRCRSDVGRLCEHSKKWINMVIEITNAMRHSEEMYLKIEDDMKKVRKDELILKGNIT